MRTRGERRQSGLDGGEQILDTILEAVPGEVDRDAVATVLWAQPEPVGGDGADLADVQERPDLLGELAQRRDRRARVAPLEQVLGLELGARAGRELGAKVGQALVPWAGLAELRRAGAGIGAGDRVELARRRARAEQLGARLERRPHALLDPHLARDLAPGREDADAVAGGHELVEVVFERSPGQILVDLLAHLVAGLDAERHARHGAERAEADHGPVEVDLAAADRAKLARRGEDLESLDRRREVAEGIAGAVRRRGDRAADRDVRQRREVRERQPGAVELARQLAVGDARAAGDGRGLAVDLHVGGEHPQ